jgi:hypothetical protein
MNGLWTYVAHDLQNHRIWIPANTHFNIINWKFWNCNSEQVYSKVREYWRNVCGAVDALCPFCTCSSNEKRKFSPSVSPTLVPLSLLWGSSSTTRALRSCLMSVSAVFIYISYRFFGGQTDAGAVFLLVFRFPCQSSFHQLLHNHHQLSSWAGTIGQ